MSSQEREHLQELLQIHNRRLQVLQLQKAQFGIYVPAAGR